MVLYRRGLWRVYHTKISLKAIVRLKWKREGWLMNVPVGEVWSCLSSGTEIIRYLKVTMDVRPLLAAALFIFRTLHLYPV